MYKTLSNFTISRFRHRLLIWIMLTVLCFSFVPTYSFAQQSTATISALSGTVLVNGQEQGKGTVLSAGDVIETQAGASVVLLLSDGSELHLGENTQINIADLAQTATGARVSYIKLLAGRLRALLSPGHQQEGSSFTVETPNAQVGVKFSQPDVEVSYDPEKQETVGIAHTIELIATNLLTGETKLVPVGSSVIIIGMMMKVIAGTTAAAIAAGSEAAAAETATGIGTGTKVAIGAGAVAAIGGLAAVAAGSGDGNDDDSYGDTISYVNMQHQGDHRWCEPDTVRAGRIVMSRAIGRWPTQEEAYAAVDDSWPPFVANGQNLDVKPLDRSEVQWHTNGPDDPAPGWGFGARVEIWLDPGVYDISSLWLHDLKTCTLTVTEP